MQTVQRFSGKRLLDIRLKRGLTQSELSRRANLREQQINRWERGKHTPGADAVGLLAATLACEISEFFVAVGDDETGDDDEEADLLDAAHALDVAGAYAMADRLRRRAREVALKTAARS